MKMTKASVAGAVLFAVSLVVTFLSMFGTEAMMLSFATMGMFCLGSLVVGIPFLARFALSSPGADRDKLPRYRLAPFMALMVAAIVLGSATIAINYVGIDPFRREMARHVDNQEESALLARAEGLDYGSMLQAERFDPAGEEPRCRFIDKAAIDRYWDRVGELQSRGPPNRASMRYEADVYPVEVLRIRFEPGLGPRFNLSLGQGERYFWGFMEKDDDSRIAFWNGTAYLLLDASSALRVDNSTSGGSLVVMKLIYSRGTSAYNMERSEARQYVYFDPGGNATRIAFERHDGNVEW